MEKFTLNDLISFGKHLLSTERTEAIINHPDAADMAPVEDRLKQVHDTDIKNWRDKRNKNISFETE
jgi:hypothetical protein